MSSIEALVSIVGDARRRDPSRFAVAGVVPRAALAPSDDEEAVGLVEAAARDRLCCVVWGGGSRVQTGGPPERYDFALSTERLTGCVRYDPDDLTVIFRAGTPLADVHTLLHEHGQWLPWEPEMTGPVTFGGAIATNTSGAPQDGFGSPRDRVLQLTAVTGYGKRIIAGAPVVKNVAGYDLHRLYCGSWGSLGLILSAAVRTEPLSSFRTLTLSLADWDEARSRAEDADRFGGVLVSFAVTASDRLVATYTLIGSERVLDWAAGAVGGVPLDRDASGHGQDEGIAEALPLLAGGGSRWGSPVATRASSFEPTDSQAEPPPQPSPCKQGEGVIRCTQDARATVRFVTHPGGALPLAQVLKAAFPDGDVVARPVSGVVWFLSADPADATSATEVGDRMGAHWRVERGDVRQWWSGAQDDTATSLENAVTIPESRIPAPSQSPTSDFRLPASPLPRRIKDTFDPTDIFSPGRFVGGL